VFGRAVNLHTPRADQRTKPTGSNRSLVGYVADMDQSPPGENGRGSEGKLTPRNCGTHSRQNIHWQAITDSLTGTRTHRSSRRVTPIRCPAYGCQSAVDHRRRTHNPPSRPSRLRSRAGLFLLFRGVGRVVARGLRPCATVVVPLSSCTVRSPLLAAICTRRRHRSPETQSTHWLRVSPSHRRRAPHSARRRHAHRTMLQFHHRPSNFTSESPGPSRSIHWIEY